MPRKKKPKQNPKLVVRVRPHKEPEIRRLARAIIELALTEVADESSNSSPSEDAA